MDYKSSALVPALYMALAVTVVGAAGIAFVAYRPDPGERVTDQLASADGRGEDPRLSPPAGSSTDASDTKESYAKAVQRILQLEELLERRTQLLEKKTALLEERDEDYRQLKQEVDNYVLLLSEMNSVSESGRSPPDGSEEAAATGEAPELQSQLGQLSTKLAETESAARQLESELNQVKSDLADAYAEMAEQELAAALVDQDNAVADASAQLLVGMGAEIVPSIFPLLSDRRVEVRVWAASVLGRFGPLAEDAVPQLREAMMDPDPRVRAAAEQSINIILD